MKKMSIAEQTLKGRIDKFRKQHIELGVQKARIVTEMATLETVIDDLENEQRRLCDMRKTMSERNLR